MAELNYNDLAKRYGIEPIPESVKRLTQLVARQDADLDEIAKVITKDPAITKRLLRAANPKADTEDEYTITTVEDALMRTGVGCVLLLAMGTPLTLALIKTAQTMLAQKLEAVNPSEVDSFPGQHVLATIDFSGKATGKVYLRLSREGAQWIASQILGLPPEELTATSEINDTIGELVNIVTGNFKSNLCDAGLDCHLSPPTVSRTDSFDIDTAPGVGLEHMAFRTDKLLIFVDVAVNPFDD